MMDSKWPLGNRPPASSSTEEEEYFSDSEKNGAVSGVDREDTVHGGENGEPESPVEKMATGSGGDALFDPEGSPMSPNISDFTIQPIRHKAAGESAVKPETPAANSRSKRTAEIDLNPGNSKKKKGSSSTGTESKREKKNKNGDKSKNSDGNDDGLSINDNDKRSKKKAMKRKRSPIKRNSEEGSHRPLILALAKQDASTQAHRHAATGGALMESKSQIAEEGVVDKSIATSDSRTADKSVENIRGVNIGTEANAAANGKIMSSKADGETDRELNMCDVGEFWNKYPYLKEFLKLGKALKLLGFQESFFYENMRLIGAEKAKEMNDKWKRLKLEEIELQVKILDLVKRQMKQVCDAVYGSG